MLGHFNWGYCKHVLLFTAISGRSENLKIYNTMYLKKDKNKMAAYIFTQAAAQRADGRLFRWEGATVDVLLEGPEEEEEQVLENADEGVPLHARRFRGTPPRVVTLGHQLVQHGA